MTIEKMPDVIYLEPKPATWGAMLMSEHQQDSATAYLRAEPVEELLKQARDQIEFCKKHDHASALDKTMMLIDKFLGDK